MRTTAALIIGQCITSCLMAAQPGPQHSNLKTHPAETGSYPSEMIPGVVRPSQDVTLGSPLDARLETLRVAEGQKVVRGQALAELDSAVSRAAVAAARVAAERVAAIDMARADLDLARTRLERVEQSAEHGAAGPMQLDEARTTLARAEASLASALEQQRVAQRNYDLEMARLEERTIRAPFDGVVVRMHAEPGQMLDQGEPVVRVVNLDRLRIDLHLPVQAFGTIVQGDACALSLDAPASGVVVATVASVEPLLDPASQTFRVVLMVDNPRGVVPAGVKALPVLGHDGTIVRQVDVSSAPASGDHPLD